MNREKSLTGYLIGINLVHIVLCFAVVLLRRYGVYEPLKLKWVALVAVVFLWYLFSYLAALGSYMSRKKTAVGFSLMAIMPVTILTAVCFALSFVPGGGWLKFFFIGSAVNFYFRPLAAVVRFLPDSAYIFYAVCIAVMIVTSLLGALSGMEASKKKIRSRKKVSGVRKEKDKKSSAVSEADVREAKVVDAEKKPDGKEAPRRRKMTEKEREQLLEETNEELNAEIERLRKKMEARKGSDD